MNLIRQKYIILLVLFSLYSLTSAVKLVFYQLSKNEWRSSLFKETVAEVATRYCNERSGQCGLETNSTVTYQFTREFVLITDGYPREEGINLVVAFTMGSSISVNLTAVVMAYAPVIGASQHSHIVYINGIHLGIPVPYRTNTVVISVTCCLLAALVALTVWLTLRRKKQEKDKWNHGKTEVTENGESQTHTNGNFSKDVTCLTEKPLAVSIIESVGKDNPLTLPRLKTDEPDGKRETPETRERHKHRGHRSHHKKRHREERARKVSDQMMNESHTRVCDEIQGESQPTPSYQPDLGRGTIDPPDSPITTVFPPQQAAEMFSYIAVSKAPADSGV